MLYACTARFNVMKNLKKNVNFLGTNKQGRRVTSKCVTYNLEQIGTKKVLIKVI
jgi:hypothetical protein